MFGANLFVSSSAHVTMRADPGVHAIFFGPAIGFDDNCTTGMCFPGGIELLQLPGSLESGAKLMT